MDPTERLRPYVAGLATTWAQSTPDVPHRSIEGSLAFVDISGFTTLTERLAAKGKIGAEEMSDLLNSAFATLLEVGYGYGASLVKWGGDAVLLLYEGNEHAAQACRGAYEMQRTMRRIGRLRTSVGVVQLRMSVGISSGMFDFFLVGDRHRELLVAGPAATETAVMEQIADAGEVVISAATVQLLPPRYVGAAKESGWLLTSAPPADPRSRWWLPTDPETAGSCMDPALREHLLTEVGDREHRQVAVGFVEVSGVDGLLERQGPEAAAGALNDLISLVQQMCEHHRVTFWETDISKDGFKVLLVAGAPRSSGQDEDAMLRAARAILDGYEGPVRLRIGVNTGRVFNGGFGPPFRRTWSVKGDAVNLAARVMAKAENGQLLATEALLRRVASRVDADLLPAFMVKGKSEPVRAAIVRSVSAERVVDAVGAFIGRRAEMDVLLDAVRGAAGGHGGGIIITGEPGVGKSRLVDHVVNRLDESTTVLRGFADDYESATPYYAVRRMLRAAIGHSMDAPDAAVADEIRRRVCAHCADLEPWLPLLAVPFDVDLPDTPETTAVQDEFRRARTQSLVIDFLSAVLTGPTVFLVDDVHVADALSSEMLGRLTTSVADRPWLVLLVGREAPESSSSDDQVLRLVVSTLSADDSRALVLDTPGGQTLAPHVIRAVIERAEGNPLFLHALADAAGSTEGDELPSTLEDLLAAQIDDLAPHSRKLLRSVSVLGSRFDEMLAAELLGRAPTAEEWAALDRFLAGHADGSRRFRTRLARDAAYEGLPFRRRVELHGRAVVAIESRVSADDDQSEALSLHCLAAHRYGDAWRYSLIAGERARHIYANSDALMFYRRAQSVLPRLTGISATEVAELWEAIGDVCARLADLAGAIVAYRSARRRAGRSEPLRRGRVAMAIGLSAHAAGDTPGAKRWLSTAVRELGAAGDDTTKQLVARVGVERAYIEHVSGRTASATKLCSLALQQSEAVGADVVTAQALLLLDVLDMTAGRGSDADRLRRLLDLCQGVGDLALQAKAWNWAGMVSYYAGRWSEAIEAYRKAQEAQERAGDEWSAAIAQGNIAEILLDQGRLSEAEPLVQSALRLWRLSKTPHDVGFGAALLGRLHARSGRFEKAFELLNEARDAFSVKDERFDCVDAELKVAEALLLMGQPRAASEVLSQTKGLLRRALQGAGMSGLRAAEDESFLVDSAQGLVILRFSAIAAVQLDDPLTARARLQLAESAARNDGALHELALVLETIAWLKGDRDSRQRVEAEQLLRRLDIVWTPTFPRTAVPGLPVPRSGDPSEALAESAPNATSGWDRPLVR